MNIALIVNKKIPAAKYGGTSRVVTWLSDALAAKGHHLYICANKGSSSKSADIIKYIPGKELSQQLPSEIDIVHYHVIPCNDPGKPWLLTSHWVVPQNYQFPPNVLFLSKAHASRYGSKEFVYNGLDPSDYIYSEKKDDYFLFLSKSSRSSKGVDRAIKLAKRMGFKLIIAGGYGLSLNRKIKYVGEVGGKKKAEFLAYAKGLIFPISWGEPFGLVTIESMVSGTPVISTPFGAVPEIVSSDGGFICNNDSEMENAVERINEKNPAACRKLVVEKFTSQTMAQNYLFYYEKILNNGSLAPRVK